MTTATRYGAEWITRSSACGARRGRSTSTARSSISNVEAEPKPFGGSRPIIMNAGSSPPATRSRHALRHALPQLAQTSRQRGGQRGASAQPRRAPGREIGVYTSGYVICRPTRARSARLRALRRRRERRLGRDRPHDRALDARTIRVARDAPPRSSRNCAARIAVGHGGYPSVGDPDDVAAGLAKLHEAGSPGSRSRS